MNKGGQVIKVIQLSHGPWGTLTQARTMSQSLLLLANSSHNIYTHTNQPRIELKSSSLAVAKTRHNHYPMRLCYNVGIVHISFSGGPTNDSWVYINWPYQDTGLALSVI